MSQPNEPSPPSRRLTGGGTKTVTAWSPGTLFRLGPAWRPLSAELVLGGGGSMAPCMERWMGRLMERRDELFEQHPPPRNKGGEWTLVLWMISVGAIDEQVPPMTEAWLLEHGHMHRATLVDALRFYVDHGVIVAEKPPQ